MAKFLTLTSNIVITDGGAEVINREFLLNQFEVHEYAEISLRIANGGTRLIGVEGTDVALIVDPVIVGLSKIWGFALSTDQQVGLTIDGAAAPVSCAPAQPITIPATCDTVQVENEGTQTANVKLIVWGER